MSEQASTTPVESFARLFGATVEHIELLARRGFLPAIENGRLPTAAAIQKMAQVLALDLVTRNEAAARLSCTPRWIIELSTKGFGPQADRGFVPFREVVVGYIKWMKDEDRRTSKSAQATRLQEARAKQIELQLAKDSKEIIAVDDSFSAIDHIFGAVKGELFGMGARVTRDLEMRRKIDTEADGILNRVCDRIDETRMALRAGADPLAAGEAAPAGSMGAPKQGLPRKRGRPRTPRPVLNAL